MSYGFIRAPAGSWSIQLLQFLLFSDMPLSSLNTCQGLKHLSASRDTGKRSYILIEWSQTQFWGKGFIKSNAHKHDSNTIWPVMISARIKDQPACGKVSGSTPDAFSGSTCSSPCFHSHLYWATYIFALHQVFASWPAVVDVFISTSSLWSCI